MATQTLYQITPIKRKGKRTLMIKKALVHIPPELWDIIYDFKDRLEHRDRYSSMMPSIPRIRNILNHRSCILNTDQFFLTTDWVVSDWEKAYLRQPARNTPSIKNHTLLLDKVEDRDNDYLMGQFGEGYLGVKNIGGRWVSRKMCPRY
tara:strand:+ start:34 stop:477 length:444 start_codon:yes stop_codon:yes gene_type:complete